MNTRVVPDSFEPLIERLLDEADLCRNEGADDIAKLLDEASQTIGSLVTELAAAPPQPENSALDAIINSGSIGQARRIAMQAKENAAATQQICVCGNPSIPNTIHRYDGPCYREKDVAINKAMSVHAPAAAPNNPLKIIFPTCGGFADSHLREQIADAKARQADGRGIPGDAELAHYEARECSRCKESTEGADGCRDPLCPAGYEQEEHDKGAAMADSEYVMRLEKIIETVTQERDVFVGLTDRAVKILWLAIPETRDWPVHSDSNNPVTAWVADAIKAQAELARRGKDKKTETKNAAGQVFDSVTEPDVDGANIEPVPAAPSTLPLSADRVNDLANYFSLPFDHPLRLQALRALDLEQQVAEKDREIARLQSLCNDKHASMLMFHAELAELRRGKS